MTDYFIFSRVACIFFMHTPQLVSYDIKTGTNNILHEFLMEDIPAYTNFSLIGFSPDGQEIAFIAKLNGQYDLYTFNVQDATINQWTNTAEIELLAAWSPMNNHLLLGTTNMEETIAFLGSPYYSQHVELIERNGIRTELLEDSGGITTASWSPDGQRIAYSRNGKLCITEIGTRVENCPQAEVFANETVARHNPAMWSANGQWLAVRVVIPQRYCFQLYVIELATTTIVGHDRSCNGSQTYWIGGIP